MKKVIYINLVTVDSCSENIQSLPEIIIVKDGTSKYIGTGLFEISAAIIATCAIKIVILKKSGGARRKNF